MVCSDELAEEDSRWSAINPNIDALQDIISGHFHSKCLRYVRMNQGAYARVFLFTLENNAQIIGRITLPVRETMKTECEIAAMELVRARTRVPVPDVYLYCSTPQNPVGAEWILMEYLSGHCLGDCFANLTYERKLRTANDLADIMSSLFKITASQCGSVIRRRRSSVSHHSGLSQRYPLQRADLTHTLPLAKAQSVVSDQFHVAPVNDVTFLEYPDQVPHKFCGPFNSEREFIQAFAFRGQPPTRPGGKMEYWAFHKVLEVFDVVAPLYHQHRCSTEAPASPEVFHFAHGDLSSWNILIDPDSGAITGVIDWEMAGFRPAWLAAVAAGWFDDDSERFLMTDMQGSRGNHADETPKDAVLRAQFRLRLASLHEGLIHHHLLGIELRAFLYVCCNEYAANAEGWLELYSENEWPVHRRGKFPFDVMKWIVEKLDVEQSIRENNLS